MPDDHDETSRPEWWLENEELRDEMDLPSYEPPRFLDGVYTHTVVSSLEETYDCSIRFVGLDVTSYDAWEVQVDRTSVMRIDRRRDSNGNTLFEMDSSEFEAELEEYLQSEAE